MTIKSLSLFNPHACCKSSVLRPFRAWESSCHSISARGDVSVMSDTKVELAVKLTASSSSSSFPSSVAPQDGHGAWEHLSQRTQRGMQRQRSHFHRAICGDEISHREQHQMPSSVEQVGILGVAFKNGSAAACLNLCCEIHVFGIQSTCFQSLNFHVFFCKHFLPQLILVVSFLLA